jgi:hypothetical protein
MELKKRDKENKDIFITRRQMLQRLGGFSMVAAGILAHFPLKSEAKDISSILPLLLEEDLFYENFETGNFSKYPWTHPGDAPWTIVSDEKYQGSYAARSGAITHSQDTILSVIFNFSEDGYISFFRKVSSETTYDPLVFYIDGVEKGRWSGELAWLRVEYPITAGTHTLRWIYFKDVSISTNSDCAWIDEIIFIPESSYSDWSDYSDAWSNYSDTWSDYSDYGVWANWIQSW